MSDPTPPAGADAGPAGSDPTPPATSPGGGVTEDQAHHWLRLIVVWVVLSATLDPLYYFLAGPHIPPGTMTDVAQGAQFDFNVLFVIALPVLLAVWIYLVYAIVMWRASWVAPSRWRAPIRGATSGFSSAGS